MKTIDSTNNDIILIKTATAVFLIDKRFPEFIELSFLTLDPKTIDKIKKFPKYLAKSSLYLCTKISDGFKDHYLLFQMLNSFFRLCNAYPVENDGIIRFYLTPCNRKEFMKLLTMFSFTRSAYYVSPSDTSTGQWWDSISQKIKHGWIRSNVFSFFGVIIKKKEDETLEDIKRLMVGYITYLK